MPLFIVKIKVDRNEQLLTEVFFVQAFESKWPTFFFWKLLPNSTFFREITKRNKQREKARFLFPKKRYISLELKSFAIITIDAGHDDDELDMAANAFSVMELLINLFPKWMVQNITYGKS